MEKGNATLNYGSIKDKLLKVRTKHVELQEEITSLKQRSSQLEVELNEAKSKYQTLEKENNRLKLAKMLVSTSSDKVEMKYKVNEMVREIDKCIALLNR